VKLTHIIPIHTIPLTFSNLSNFIISNYYNFTFHHVRTSKKDLTEFAQKHKEHSKIDPNQNRKQNPIWPKHFAPSPCHKRVNLAKNCETLKKSEQF